MSEALLHNRRFVLIEDECFIAEQRELEDAGALAVGPAATVKDALALLVHEAVDGAILDVNFDNEGVFPVADVLRSRRIPLLFATGYNASDLPPAWRNVALLEKPVDTATVARLTRR